MSYNDYSDQELILGFEKGESRYFEILVNRYKTKVFTYLVITVKDRAVAEDLFQETFIKVLKSIRNGKYSHDGKFISWVMRIAHNLAIDYFRKSKQLKTVSNIQQDGELDLFNNSDFSEITIEDQIIDNQIKNTVKSLIDLLPADQKEIIIMRHYKNMSFKEIAEQTGVSINTALGRMRYAVLNLRKIVKENGIVLTVR